jgi:DNA-binding transcriptional ArsR family regulator
MADEWPHGADPAADPVAAALRALTHPVRVRLVGLLRSHGPSTATRLAECMGLTSGATSYHLRRLCAAGLVEEETARGNARERWWRSAHLPADITRLAGHEPEDAQAFLRAVVVAHEVRARLALDEFPAMPPQWRAVLDLSDWALWITPDEARALHDELAAVIGRYRRHTPEAVAGAPAGAARFGVIAQLLPEPDAGAIPGAVAENRQ